MEAYRDDSILKKTKIQDIHGFKVGDLRKKGKYPVRSLFHPIMIPQWYTVLVSLTLKRIGQHPFLCPTNRIGLLAILGSIRGP
jgi:hypothetical protein